MRVVPNLYPALERQEVVVHTPRHVESVAELSVGGARAGRRGVVARAAAAARDEGFPYVHAFVNEGAAAGASRPHTHSQLAWLREPPPAVVAEETGDCRVCAHLADELADGRGSSPSETASSRWRAWAGRLPYELLHRAGRARAGSGSTRRSCRPRSACSATSSAASARSRATVPLNAWLHDGPHWHLEVVPRLTVHAGLELGAGIYVNTLDPERGGRAAARS